MEEVISAKIQCVPGRLDESSGVKKKARAQRVDRSHVAKDSEVLRRSSASILWSTHSGTSVMSQSLNLISRKDAAPKTRLFWTSSPEQ